MTVNWTPFLALFPLRLPANDMVVANVRVWVKELEVKELVLMGITVFA